MSIANARAAKEYRKVSVHDEQVAFIDWCFRNTAKYPMLDLIFAIPNGAMLGGGRVGAIRANILKAEGMRPGVSDLFLPCARGKYHGLFLETKTNKGVVSDNQKEFIAGVETQGYYAVVCHGASELIEATQWYLEIK